MERFQLVCRFAVWCALEIRKRASCLIIYEIAFLPRVTCHRALLPFFKQLSIHVYVASMTESCSPGCGVCYVFVDEWGRCVRVIRPKIEKYGPNAGDSTSRSSYYSILRVKRFTYRSCRALHVVLVSTGTYPVQNNGIV